MVGRFTATTTCRVLFWYGLCSMLAATLDRGFCWMSFWGWAACWLLVIAKRSALNITDHVSKLGPRWKYYTATATGRNMTEHTVLAIWTIIMGTCREAWCCCRWGSVGINSPTTERIAGLIKLVLPLSRAHFWALIIVHQSIANRCDWWFDRALLIYSWNSFS